MADFVMTLV